VTKSSAANNCIFDVASNSRALLCESGSKHCWVNVLNTVLKCVELHRSAVVFGQE